VKGILEDNEDTDLRFHSVYGFEHPGNFLLGLLGWREKRGSVSPLSESPLGQPLVPRDDKDRELIVGLKLFLTNNPVILSFQRKRGDTVIRLREGKREGMRGLSNKRPGNYCYR
jgi:hypothetical protein